MKAWNDTVKDDANYVELLENKTTYEARKADKKRKHEDDAESMTDWFMVGTVDVLTQNIAKVANQRDKNRIRSKIEQMNEEAKKTRDLTRKAKKNGELDKVHLKLWTHSYMVKKDQPKLKQVLGLEADCSYEELFSKLKVDIDGDECDLEGYEELKRTDEWIDLGKKFSLFFPSRL